MKILQKHVAHVTGLLAVPYGYTVAVWTAGHVATAYFGNPGAWEIAAFLVGAVVAFLLLSVIALPAEESQVPQKVPSAIVLNALPLVALPAAALATLVPWPGLGFAVSSFSVTLVYPLSAVVYMIIAERRRANGQDTGKEDTAPNT